MILKAILSGLAFVAIYALFIIVPHSVRVFKLQKLLSKSYAGFITHLAMNDWSYSHQPIPDSIKLVYSNSFGRIDNLYIKYNGVGSEGKALKYLIRSYNE